MRQNRWDKKYQASSATSKACYALRSHRHLIPSSGKALDLACGLGANAMYLVQAGLSVEAWDYSTVALEKLTLQTKSRNQHIDTKCIDLEEQVIPLELRQSEKFDFICVSNYLYRPIFRYLATLLKPQGVLVYETFYHPNNSANGPKQNRFLLKQDELSTLLPSLDVISYWHTPSHPPPLLPGNKTIYCARKP